MTYELALKLKNAGFPQDIRGILEDGHHEVAPYYPTLAELIKACGNDFEALIKQAGGWGAISSRESYMQPKKNSFIGSTPDEAVANLWLALHSNIY